MIAGVGVAGVHLKNAGIVPNVTVGETDAGGMSASELRNTLQLQADAVGETTIVFTSEEVDVSVTLREVGYRSHIEEAVAEAAAIGHEGGIMAATADQIASFWRSYEIPVEESLDAGVLTRWLDRVEADLNFEPSPGDLIIDPIGLSVTTVLPTSGRTVDRAIVESAVLAALETDGSDTFELPLTFAPAPTDADEVARLGRLVRTALNRGMTLTWEGIAVELGPTVLARALDFVVTGDAETGYGVDLVSDPEVISEAFGIWKTSLYQPPVSAVITPPEVDQLPVLDEKGDVTWSPRGPGLTVTPPLPAQEFNAEATSLAVVDLVKAGATRAPLALEDVPGTEPFVEVAEGLESSYVIGTFTTYHRCCQSRVTNIQLMADTVDGTIVLPGAQLSINEVVGKRTSEKGFVPAGAIFNGELRDEVGAASPSSPRRSSTPRSSPGSPSMSTRRTASTSPGTREGGRRPSTGRISISHSPTTPRIPSMCTPTTPTRRSPWPSSATTETARSLR